MSKEEQGNKEIREQADTIDSALVGEIDQAADQVAAELKADPEKDEGLETGRKISGEGGDTPPEADDNKGKKHDEIHDDDDKEKEDSEDDAIADDLLERAVKAGMGISEAKAFSSKSALEKVCGLLETRKADDNAGDGGDKKADKKADEDLDPSQNIPDLDPDKYDENLVAGFKAMKELIGQQFKTIRDLKESAAKASATSEFESLMAPKANIEGKAREAVEAKYNFLKKAYEADGSEVKSSDVLDEAIAIVIGREASQVIDKKEKLEARSKQHIQRASKAPGKPGTDPWSDVASEVDEAFGSKP